MQVHQKVTQYMVSALPADHSQWPYYVVVVQWNRRGPDGPGWYLTWCGCPISNDGRLAYDIPDEEEDVTFGMSLLDAALEVARRVAPKVAPMNRTPQMVLDDAAAGQ